MWCLVRHGACALAAGGSQSGWWRIQFMRPPLHTYWVLDFSGPIKMTDRFLDYGVGRWVSNESYHNVTEILTVDDL